MYKVSGTKIWLLCIKSAIFPVQFLNTADVSGKTQKNVKTADLCLNVHSIPISGNINIYNIKLLKI